MAIPNEPLTRAEQYLNKIATGSGNTPDEPLTRIEMYLAEIAKNEGGGGSGGGGTIFVDVSNDYTATKTSGEIFQLVMDGNTVVFRQSRGNDKFYLWTCLSADNVYEYNFHVIEDNQVSYFTSDTASDYPSLDGK